MEIKFNREIRNYNETMFFGLSMRQFFFSIAAVGIAVLLYLLLKDSFGVETLSWMCILGAAPFAAMGFITYHGMTAEQFLWVWFRSEILEPKVLYVKHNNAWYELMKEVKKSDPEIQIYTETLPRGIPYSKVCAGCDPHPGNLGRRHFPCRQPLFQDLWLYRYQLPIFRER